MNKPLFSVPIDLLRALIIFNIEKNIDKAAKVIGVTQPTLSRQLVTLQSYFDYPLFEKDGREKKLTLFAKSICKNVDTLISQINQKILISIDEFSKEENVQLSIGGRQEFVKKYIDKVSFKGTFEVLNLSSREVVESLQQKKIDFGITHLNFDSLDYSKKILVSDRPAIIIPKKFLNEKPDIKKWSRVCTQFPCLSYNKDLLFIKEFVEIFKIPNIPIHLYFPDWQYLEEAASLGKGWAILPSQFIVNSNKFHTIHLPNEDRYTFKMYLYYRREYTKLEWFKKLIL